MSGFAEDPILGPLPFPTPAAPDPTEAEPERSDPQEIFILLEGAGGATRGIRVSTADLDVDEGNHFADLGAVVSTRIPDNLKRALEIYLHHEGVPERTTADAIRNALYHYLKTRAAQIQLLEPGFQSIMLAEKIRCDAETWAKNAEQLDQVIEHLSAYLTRCINAAELGEAARAIQTEWERAEAIKLPAWQRLWLGEIAAAPVVRGTVLLLHKLGFVLPTTLVKLSAL